MGLVSVNTGSISRERSVVAINSHLMRLAIDVDKLKFDSRKSEANQ